MSYYAGKGAILYYSDMLLCVQFFPICLSLHTKKCRVFFERWPMVNANGDNSSRHSTSCSWGFVHGCGWSVARGTEPTTCQSSGVGGAGGVGVFWPWACYLFRHFVWKWPGWFRSIMVYIYIILLFGGEFPDRLEQNCSVIFHPCASYIVYQLYQYHGLHDLDRLEMVLHSCQLVAQTSDQNKLRWMNDTFIIIASALHLDVLCRLDRCWVLGFMIFSRVHLWKLPGFWFPKPFPPVKTAGLSGEKILSRPC